jgi:hypothetical protein
MYVLGADFSQVVKKSQVLCKMLQECFQLFAKNKNTNKIWQIVGDAQPSILGEIVKIF